MNLFSKVRKLFIFATLVLALLLSGDFLPSNGGGSTSEACSVAVYNYSRIYTYYSDASHTTEIGWRYIGCNGRATTTGITSQYYTWEDINVCCGPYEC